MNELKVWNPIRLRFTTPSSDDVQQVLSILKDRVAEWPPNCRTYPATVVALMLAGW